MAAEISIASAQRVEAGYIQFTVTLSAPVPATPVTVAWRTRAGTGLTDVDYNELAYGTLTIQPGQTTGTIQVYAYGDNLDETDESFTLELSNPTNAVLAGGEPVLRTTGIVLDDDGIGSNLALFVSSPLLVEGNAGVKYARFEVLLSRTYSSDIVIPYQTANGTAVAGQDYVATSGDLTFLAGQTSAYVDVAITGDAAIEPTESFSLVLSPPAAVASGGVGAAGQATIVDDDAGSSGTPTLSVIAASRVEAGYMFFEVLLSAPAPASGSTVAWRTQAGTGLADVDYDDSSGTLTIAPGKTTGTIQVYAYGDNLDETDETFALELSNPTGAVFAGGVPVLRTTGFVLDDDGPGSNLALSAISPVIVEGDSGTKVVHFEALLSRAANATVVIPFLTQDGTAVAGQDYVATSGALTFLPGQTSASADVQVIGDLSIESLETFNVLFTASSSGPPTAATSATGTIYSDDSRANRPARNDVNGDRRGDLLWQNDSGAPSVWAMQPGGGSASVGAYLNYQNPGPSWRLVGTGDLNADGRADLIWQNSNGLPSGWLVSADGSSIVGYPVFNNPGPSWRLIGAGDLDGDGRSDLIWQNQNGAVSAWLIAPGGTGVQSYVNLGNPGASWRLAGGADVNGDGKSDLVFQDGSGTISAWLMGGSLGAPAVSTYQVLGNPGASWTLATTGDLSGDGRDDLVFQNQNGTPSAWLMGAGGTSVATYVSYANPGGGWRLADTTDANGDGRTDLVWQNGSGLPSLWLMGAGGVSVDSYAVVTNPGPTWHVV